MDQFNMKSSDCWASGNEPSTDFFFYFPMNKELESPKHNIAKIFNE